MKEECYGYSFFVLALRKKCFEIIHYLEPGKETKWVYPPSKDHLEVLTKFEGTKATPEFLQVIAFEVYVKNVAFGLLHQWLTDMGLDMPTPKKHLVQLA